MKKPARQKIKKYAGHFATGVISALDLSGSFAMQDVREDIRNLDKNDSLSQDLRSIAEDFKAVMPVFYDEIKRQVNKENPQVTFSIHE